MKRIEGYHRSLIKERSVRRGKSKEGHRKTLNLFYVQFTFSWYD